MDYTLKEYYINGENKELEKELLSVWMETLFKKEPLGGFSRKTIHEKFREGFHYFEEYFRGNLCFHCELGFAVFGFGQKWLDKKIPVENPTVLIMGATKAKSLKDTYDAIGLLNRCFSLLREKGWKNIVWNINREKKRKPFERLLSKIGENKGEYWQAL